MKKRYFTPFSIGSSLLLLLLVGCQGQSGDTSSTAVRGVTDSTIVIGTWAPLTGPAAAWGAVGRGIQTYFEMINAEGGIHGRKIEFILKDDSYQPTRTISAVREMVERDGVFAFVGGVGTATGMAVMDYIADNEIIWVTPASGATYWAYPPKKTIFSAYIPYFDESKIITEYAINELGIKKIGVLYQNDDFGQSGVIGARLAAEGTDAEVVATASVELADSDLSSQALLLQNEGAEAVLLWGTPRHAAIMVGESAKIGYTPQFLGSTTLSDAALMNSITQGLWEGAIFNGMGLQPNADNPVMEKYRAAQQEYMPEERPGVFFFSGFVFAEPLVEGLRRAGRDLTVDSFVAAMETIEDFQQTGPMLSYGADQRQGGRSIIIGRAGAGDEVELLTDWVTSDLDIEAAIQALEEGI